MQGARCGTFPESKTGARLLSHPGIPVLIFLSCSISFWKKKKRYDVGFKKNQFYRVEKEDISSIRLVMPKLRTPNKQQCKINKVLSRPSANETLTNLTKSI